MVAHQGHRNAINNTKMILKRAEVCPLKKLEVVAGSVQQSVWRLASQAEKFHHLVDGIEVPQHG